MRTNATRRLYLLLSLAGTVLVGAPITVRAQDMGGLLLAQQGYGSGYALTTPRSGAQQMQSLLGATDRSATHQAMIGRIRGDAGFLGGFTFGTPNSASGQERQARATPGWSDASWAGATDSFPTYATATRASRRTVIINQFDGPVAIGNGNVVQQQNAAGNGPIAQQQVSSMAAGASSATNGARNVVMGNGQIVQRVPSVR